MVNPIRVFLDKKQDAKMTELILIYIANYQKAILQKNTVDALHWNLKALSTSSRLIYPKNERPTDLEQPTREQMPKM